MITSNEIKLNDTRHSFKLLIVASSLEPNMSDPIVVSLSKEWSRSKSE